MKFFRVTNWYLIVLGLASIPYGLIVLAGTAWLYQAGLLWHFMILSAVVTFAGWQVLAWLKRKNLAAAANIVSPGETWTEAARRAWAEVDVIAARVQDQDLSLDNPEPMWAVLRDVLEAVARKFHPDTPQAVLQIPVPHVLRVAELVAADFRVAFSEHVPGAHILTLNDWQHLRRLAALWQPVYMFYRVVSFGVSPISALLREMRDSAAGGLVNSSTDEVKRWAVGFCVRKAGYYAIQLYSGHLELEGVEFRAYQTPQSQRDAARDAASRDRLAEEPLRILVLGQVKSGKSSLINALFGETRAAVDVVPRTRHVDPYLLERDGVPRAIILDTAGYEAVDAASDAFQQFGDEIADCDLMLLVLSARSATRGADRQLLDRIRRHFQERPDRIMPPLLTVLTHVDQLRPLGQWAPPYDLAHPADEKARHIGEAVRTVAEDLALGDEQAVVPVCLKAEQLYNVAEAVAPAILHAASEAQRVKYLRCLRQFHREEYWQRLWQQALNSGRLLLKAGQVWMEGRGGSGEGRGGG